MKVKELAALIVIVIGAVGTFASILSMNDSGYKPILMTLFVVLALAGVLISVYGRVDQAIDIRSGWSMLTNAKRLGIRRIWVTGTSEDLQPNISKAARIRIMVLSGAALIRATKNEVLTALTTNKAFIQVMVGEPNNTFVKDVEKMENRNIGEISAEIDNTLNRLNEYARESHKNKRPEEVGQLKVGFFCTQMRSSLIICDDNWGWLTLSLPPDRAPQSMSLELVNCDGGLLSNCIKHFDRCWEMAESQGKTKVLP